jgi:glycosyltransferase involved in cell wall biosynthesis
MLSSPSAPNVDLVEPVVEVLMSTYQGEQYLGPQLDSVLDQSGVRLCLTVRDDGSNDGTLALLRERAASDHRLRVRAGSNLGLPVAFFRLIEESDPDVDLWALSDQDDVWLPQKLKHAAEALRGLGGPALYCSRVLVVDQDLRALYPHPLPRRGASFGNALVQNVATGCTIVLNRRAREVLRGRWPSSAVMHDAWLYLVLAGTGTVVYDPRPSVLYRQHFANTIGMGRGRAARVAGRVRRQLTPGRSGAHGRQNRCLLETHGELLRPEARMQLEEFLGGRHTLRARVRYVLAGEARRQTKGSDLVMRALYLTGRI